MSSKYNYEPFYNEGIKPFLVRIPLGRFSCITVSLPFLGMLFCIAWSEIYDFEKSTSTHCQIYNVLPSLSAAIGNFSPQKEVWQWAIGLHVRIYFIYQFPLFNFEHPVQVINISIFVLTFSGIFL